MELLLTVEQAAERLHLQPNTVRVHLSRGLLRGVKRGRQWRIPVSALTEDASTKTMTTVTKPGSESPLARALAMVEERDARSKSKASSKGAIYDAAADIRAMREAETP
jgi:excisionase family DNA binding protein